MKRKPFAANDKYIIYPLDDEDRSEYSELHRQVNGENSLFHNSAVADLMWEQTVNGETRVYAIYNKECQFCGSMELQKPTSNTPEIGIDLLENFQNKGIAPSVILLFAKAVCERQTVQYFLIKIAASNSHSRHVFEKLGAEFIREEESYYKKIKNIFVGLSATEEDVDDFAKEFEPFDEPIYVYKLSTDTERNTK